MTITFGPLPNLERSRRQNADALLDVLPVCADRIDDRLAVRKQRQHRPTVAHLVTPVHRVLFLDRAPVRAQSTLSLVGQAGRRGVVVDARILDQAPSVTVDHRAHCDVAHEHRQRAASEVDVLGVLEKYVGGCFCEHRVFAEHNPDEPVNGTLERREQRRALQAVVVLVAVLVVALRQIRLSRLAHGLCAAVQVATEPNVWHLFDIRGAAIVGTRRIVAEAQALHAYVLHASSVFDGVAEAVRDRHLVKSL